MTSALARAQRNIFANRLLRIEEQKKYSGTVEKLSGQKPNCLGQFQVLRDYP